MTILNQRLQGCTKASHRVNTKQNGSKSESTQQHHNIGAHIKARFYIGFISALFHYVQCNTKNQTSTNIYKCIEINLSSYRTVEFTSSFTSRYVYTWIYLCMLTINNVDSTSSSSSSSCLPPELHHHVHLQGPRSPGGSLRSLRSLRCGAQPANDMNQFRFVHISINIYIYMYTY